MQQTGEKPRITKVWKLENEMDEQSLTWQTQEGSVLNQELGEGSTNLV